MSSHCGNTTDLLQTTNSIFDSDGLPLSQESSKASQVQQVESNAEESVDGKVCSQIWTAERRKQWDNFHEKQRNEAEIAAKLEKLEKQKAHSAVLQQIALDRLEKKQSENDAHVLNTEKHVAHSTSDEIQSAQASITMITTIQIRYPDGSAIKHQFNYSDAFAKIWDSIREEYPDTHTVTLLQPFPRHEFSSEDFEKSFSDLRLVPSASLILNLKTSNEPIGDGLPPSYCQTKSHQTQRGSQNGPVPAAASNYRPLPAVHYNQNEILDPLRRGRLHPLHDQPLPNVMADMHQMLQQAGLGHAWGQGQKLNEDPSIDLMAVNYPDANPMDLARAAALQRATCKTESPGSDCSISLISHSTVPCLLNHCIQVVIKKLLDPSSCPSALNLPADVAEKILLQMEKDMVLNSRSLQPFLSCHLTTVVMDFYPYVTNEFLYALRLHTTIQNISLVSCSLINDAGLHHLKSLKRILTLNLRDCKQITDISFSVFLELPHLTSLNLEGTKITDLGIQSYINKCSKTLQHLNLGRTSITNKALESISELINLRSLDLDETRITCLQHLTTLKQLEALSIRVTPISAETLVYLRQLLKLSSLNISQLPLVEGDRALQLIQDLNLINLQLPSRLTTSDIGLSCITGMRLTSLDLSNYINVTDIGAKHLSQIQSLKVLYLSNTKIADEGLLALQNIHNLEVLFLDRTLITDIGTEAFKRFPKLTELSLSYTRAGKKCLKNGNLNGCHSLTKLNLNYTQVNDEGLRKLCLPNLIMISVDGTRLRSNPHVLLTNCPQLQHISAKNVQARGVYDSDDDDK